MKGWDWEVERSIPDPNNTESVGKTPRHWISLVHYSKGGGILDGPGVICVDLQLETASWEMIL